MQTVSGQREKMMKIRGEEEKEMHSYLRLEGSNMK